MAKEKEILELSFKGDSQRQIAQLLQVSRNTAAKIIKASQDRHVDSNALASMEAQELHQRLFPEEAALLYKYPQTMLTSIKNC